MPEELLVTRRNLPHWELGGSTYFITYRCTKGVTLGEAARSIVLDNWHHWHGKRYLLHAAVVMPDHVHALITPKSDSKSGWYSLKDILHTNKSYTAHEVNKVQAAMAAYGKTSVLTELSETLMNSLRNGPTWPTTRSRPDWCNRQKRTGGFTKTQMPG